MINKLITKEIKIPKNVIVSLEDNNLIKISSIHGNFELKNINKNIQITINQNYIILESSVENKRYLGLYTSLLKTNLKGFSQKHKISLFLNGIGFKVKKTDNILNFKLGYSHDINIEIPKDINVSIIQSTQIIFYGPNWEQLTQFVHNIKKLRKIEPYKGKGILLKNETVLRKEGKKNKK